MGVRAAVCTHFSEGGRGAAELAEAVTEISSTPNGYSCLYPLQASLKEKIETLATRIYGADGVDYTPLADRQLASYERNGFGNLPICIAKTQYSLSHDGSLKGAPTGFRLPVREVRASVGAGFVYPICGDMRTMPGLSSHPAAESIDLDENGDVVGLY
jgi:formate--tetrahydrofolate ligase